jgi:hypothetical protein
MRPNQARYIGMPGSSGTNRIEPPKSFSKKEVDLAQTPLFFPEGFEKIFLAIYFVTLPYIAGLLFLLFYVAKGKLELFSSLYKDSYFILTWAIGYELLAALILIYIFKMALGFAYESRKLGIRQQFRRP